MATRYTLKGMLSMLSLPFRLMSMALELFDIDGIRDDIVKCLLLVETYNNVTMSKPLLHTLIIAEDRRNQLHSGIDPIAMLRAIYSNVWNKGRQGASTIEQQFVRVALGRYDKTTKRKLREQLLAISVCKRISKERIATAYLSIAYYGSNLSGTDGIHRMCPLPFDRITYGDAIRIVARLKYPEPSRTSETWKERHELRCAYLGKKLLADKVDVVSAWQAA